MTDTVPTPPADEYARGAEAVMQRISELLNEGVPAHPDPVDARVVRIAVLALAAFGENLSRADAAAVLPLWAHYGTLTPAEVDAILGCFPEPPPSPMPPGGWLSDPSTGGDQ